MQRLEAHPLSTQHAQDQDRPLVAHAREHLANRLAVLVLSGPQRFAEFGHAGNIATRINARERARARRTKTKADERSLAGLCAEPSVRNGSSKPKRDVEPRSGVLRG